MGPSAASAMNMRQLLIPTKAQPFCGPANSKALLVSCWPEKSTGLMTTSRCRKSVVRVKSSRDEARISVGDNGQGVSLGTMKLPVDTDVPRFEALLFQVFLFPYPLYRQSYQ